ncbi:MAG: ABC transporter substrate-binding protein, partial [Spirochaetales bacterium]|nr:ABC transporter substrate-binding protein [Spirochaetales bacterium]
MKKRSLLFILLFFSTQLYAQININLATSNTKPEELAAIRYLLDAFELYNPDISVNIIKYNENDKTSSIISKQNDYGAPDLIIADSLMLSAFNSDKVLDNDFIGEVIKEIGEDSFFKGPLVSLEKEETFFGVPFTAWLQVLWYRADLFKKYKLPVPDTIDAILNAAQVFEKFEDGVYGIVLGKKDDVYTQQCFLHLAGAMGLQLDSDKDGYFFDEETFSKAADYYSNLREYSTPGLTNWRARDFFFQKKAAMMFYSTFIMDDLAIPEIAADSLTNKNFTELENISYSNDFLSNTGIVTTITGSRKYSFGSVVGIGVFDNNFSAEKKEALDKFIMFLFRPDVYNTWLHMNPGGMLPVVKSSVDDNNFYRDPV